MFHDCYRKKRVLLTGHTGFKGSWLAFWLKELGAELCGIGLPMPGKFSHFSLLKIEMGSYMTDIRDPEEVLAIFQEFQPEIVFHLAAQPLVRLSYREPAETFASNVMGTVHVLEACRKTPSVRGIVAISSDKCYENREQTQGYKEGDPMGGFDPYSASKGCTELVIASYRRSFFNNDLYGEKHHTLLASGRAGNVIGGGDWAEDRLIPDIMKAASEGREAEIRNPRAVRPWQHVLEPLSGYLALGEKLLAGGKEFAEGWNFGPAHSGLITVEEAACAMEKEWDNVRIRIKPPENAPHEANLLMLDCTKAKEKLSWHGVWTPREAFHYTAQWYKDFHTSGKVDTLPQMERYWNAAEKEHLEWTK